MLSSHKHAASLTRDKTDYNNSVWFYDALAYVIFGKTINNSQTCFLKSINQGSSILIVGGGTGWILDEISKRQSSGLEIVYIEKSIKMIKTASKRLIGSNKVIFIHEAVEICMLNKSFDVVITPFLFDSFSNPTIDLVFKKLADKLKPGGFWLYSDFIETKKLRHKLLLKIMYLFFKVVCKIDAEGLPDMALRFKKFNLDLIDEKRFYGNFLTGRIYMSRLNDGNREKK